MSTEVCSILFCSCATDCWIWVFVAAETVGVAEEQQVLAEHLMALTEGWWLNGTTLATEGVLPSEVARFLSKDTASPVTEEFKFFCSCAVLTFVCWEHEEIKRVPGFTLCGLSEVVFLCSFVWPTKY